MIKVVTAHVRRVARDVAGENERTLADSLVMHNDHFLPLSDDHL